MNKNMLHLCWILFPALISCRNDTAKVMPSNDDSISQQAITEVKKDVNQVYASIDSVFEIDQDKIRIHIDQLDMTDAAYASGDTLPRPTYICLTQIFNEDGQKLLEDSVKRDTWGYPGKIESILKYEISLPELFLEGNEIFIKYNVFEYNTLDAINGFLVFNISTFDSRYYWEESDINF